MTDFVLIFFDRYIRPDENKKSDNLFVDIKKRMAICFYETVYDNLYQTVSINLYQTVSRNLYRTYTKLISNRFQKHYALRFHGLHYNIQLDPIQLDPQSN